MEKIGQQIVLSYFDGEPEPRSAASQTIREGVGHRVLTYFQMAKKVAELQFLNLDHVLLFRGQPKDYQTKNQSSTLKASIFRLDGPKIPTKKVMVRRFETLRKAETGLVKRYEQTNLLGLERLKRHRVLRWSILQHYDVCRTPLFDVTQSLRVAASFASIGNESSEAFVFVFGVPNLSGAVTASAEAGLQIVRLSSACPPDAVRPHLQEGYLLGEYPEITDFEQHSQYKYYEMDFGRRLVAKFRFNPQTFWSSSNFLPAPKDALYPKEGRDRLYNLTRQLKESLDASVS